KDVILETAGRMDISPIIIEKDFWVCWTLNKIVAIPEMDEHITFKGGTSLSKVFRLIERFSEDIDLAFHRSYLGFGGKNEPEEAISKKQTDKRIEELTRACIREVETHFVPLLNKDIEYELGNNEAHNWSLTIDPRDPQTVYFYYPSILDVGFGNYVEPAVKIEMGARSDDWPVMDGVVTSYIEETFEHLFDPMVVHIKTLSAERTFWEKATILHAEYHRPEDKSTSSRVSRHYYDLYQMHTKGVSENAIKKLDLLARVMRHKSIYFRSGWAKYEEAVPGSLRLAPRNERIADLKQDYEKMQKMFFRDPPSFEVIMGSLQEMEDIINQQVSVNVG
ncbi:hypothetical protein AYO37_00765, partial [Opitutia bacterium SCGC AG-212-L18]